DERARGAPAIVEPGQRSAGAGLQLAMGDVGPRLRIADAALDGPPGVVAVQRLEHRRPGQTVLALQGMRDVPAHVEEDAAEVEDDRVESNSGRPSPFREGRSAPARAPRWS